MDNEKGLRFYMDETSAPYEEGQNPFEWTEEDEEFEKRMVEKYHLAD